MKNSFLFISLFFMGLLALLSQCKKDPPVNTTPPTNDSAYIGTPYKFPTLGLRYRKIILPTDYTVTNEGVQLGRMLFYDSTLSVNNTISCGSCHRPGNAFGDFTSHSLNVTGTTKRNTMPLYNLGMKQTFFWDGRVNTIANAAKDAFHGEQNFIFSNKVTLLQQNPLYDSLFKKAYGKPGDITEDKVYKSIEQFLLTLISTNSPYDKIYQGTYNLTADEQAGFNLFMDASKGDCFHCHVDASYLSFQNLSASTSESFANNGLDTVNSIFDFKDFGLGDISKSNLDYGRFKIPSLRNLSYTAPYMHDGRFNTLEEVVNFYSDSLHISPTVDTRMQLLYQRGGHLNPTEKAQIVAFLKTLDDPDFIHNPLFKNPF